MAGFEVTPEAVRVDIAHRIIHDIPCTLFDPKLEYFSIPVCNFKLCSAHFADEEEAQYTAAYMPSIAAGLPFSRQGRPEETACGCY
jgi:hypothetical protein